MWAARHGAVSPEEMSTLAATYKRHRGRFVRGFEHRGSSAFQVATFETDDPELADRARREWERYRREFEERYGHLREQWGGRPMWEPTNAPS